MRKRKGPRLERCTSVDRTLGCRLHARTVRPTRNRVESQVRVPCVPCARSRIYNITICVTVTIKLRLVLNRVKGSTEGTSGLRAEHDFHPPS